MPEPISPPRGPRGASAERLPESGAETLLIQLDPSLGLVRVNGRPFQTGIRSPTGPRLSRKTPLQRALPGPAAQTVLSWVREHPEGVILVQGAEGWSDWERLRDPAGGALLPVVRWLPWDPAWSGSGGALRALHVQGPEEHLAPILALLPEGVRAPRLDPSTPGWEAEGPRAVHCCDWTLGRGVGPPLGADLIVYDPWPKRAHPRDLIRFGERYAARHRAPTLVSALEGAQRDRFFRCFYGALTDGGGILDAFLGARADLDGGGRAPELVLLSGPGVPTRRPSPPHRSAQTRPIPPPPPRSSPPRRAAEAPRPPVLQLGLRDPRTGEPFPLGPLTCGATARLELQLDLGAGASAQGSALALDLSIQSATFGFDGVPAASSPAGALPVWTTRPVQGLRVPSATSVDITAHRPGKATLRALVYRRNLLICAIRLDARVVATSEYAPAELGLLDGLSPRALHALEGAGLRTCEDLVAAPLEALIALLGTSPTRALELQREARALAEGRGVTLEYAAELDAAELAGIAPRALAVHASLAGRTHLICVRSVDGSIERAIQIPPDRVGRMRASAQATLDAIMTRGDAYAFAARPRQGVAQNEGSAEQLRVAMIQLARQGYYLYRDLFGQVDRAALQSSLREPGTISVSRLASGEPVPWALVYDLALSEGWREAPSRVCTILFSGQKTLESLDHYQHDEAPPQDPVRCAARPDCPLRDPKSREKTVCPWGFWGFKHQIELPPLRCDAEEPLPLREEIDAAPERPLHLLVATYPGLSRAALHRAAIAEIFARSRVTFAWRSLEDVCAGLSRRDLQLIYLYGHGQLGEQMGEPRAALALSADDALLTPYLLEDLDEGGKPRFAFPMHPLVFINGCQTAEMGPELAQRFVETFARLGAAGVIGTEVAVWEALATEVAERIWAGLLEGQPLGALLRSVRLELLRKRNPLGLVYTAYASAGLRLSARISPPPPAPPASSPPRPRPRP